MGGGGSSFKKLIPDSNKGPIKTIFIGDIILDTVFFHGFGDVVPRKESGCLGKPRRLVDPKSVVVIKRKANPEMIVFLKLFHLVSPSTITIIVPLIIVNFSIVVIILVFIIIFAVIIIVDILTVILVVIVVISRF